MTLTQNLTQMIKATRQDDRNKQVFVYCNPQYFQLVYLALTSLDVKNVTLIDDPAIKEDNVIVTRERLDE